MRLSAIWSKISLINKEESGLTLPDTLMGLIVSGAICGVMSVIIVQTNDIVVDNRNHMVTVNQAHNAGYWIQVDTKVAQTVEVDEGVSGLPLTLSWVDWDNTEHEVTYSTQNNELLRTHTVNSGTPSVLAVAGSIDTAPYQTNCEYVDGVLTFTITTTEGSGTHQSSETRVLNYEPRTS
ncbi:MAG: hypothetical protein HQ553_15410 [Chloroflexi bacterium]|nr:hypothetical protein [Chloroflexota bacterium]